MWVDLCLDGTGHVFCCIMGLFWMKSGLFDTDVLGLEEIDDWFFVLYGNNWFKHILFKRKGLGMV